MPGEGLARPVPTSPNLRRKPEEWGEAMTERFFHPLDDEITISAKDELVEAILEIDFERGAERRTSDLSGTVHAGGIPTNAGLSELSGVSIRHPEARDAGFCVETQWSGNGLEVTEITSQRYRRGLAGTAPGETCDPSQFSSTALPGGGWAGNAAEREWVDLLISSVLKKVEDYEQGSAFAMLDRNRSRCGGWVRSRRGDQDPGSGSTFCSSHELNSENRNEWVSNLRMKKA